ncbi:MAG: right-handed parallel beta-helix repeat-containing protein [Pseudomonadota bacterium]
MSRTKSERMTRLPHRRRVKSAMASVTALLLSACVSTVIAHADETFLASDRAADLPDFSYAGYEFGLGTLPNVFGETVHAADYGVVADDGVDDSDAMLAAFAAVHEMPGPVTLLLPKGQIELSEVLPITRSQLVIRGAGAGTAGTELYFTRPLEDVDTQSRFEELRTYLRKYEKRQRDPAKNVDELFSEYSWTGGFIWIQKPESRAASYLEEYDPPITKLADIQSGTRGERTLRVDSPEGLRVGQALQVQWFNRRGESGPLLKEIYGDTDLAIGSHHWTFMDRPLVRQTTRIMSITGNSVEIGDPLLHNINDAVPAQFSQWDHLEQVGLEDFSISFPDSPYFGHHLERGYNGIYVTSVIDGWVRDVRFENADSGILTYNSANLTIENIRSVGDRPAHYAVHLGNVHNVLVNNLTIENPVLHSLTFNTQATKNVYKNATVLNASVLDQHAGANHQNLFDNVTLHVNALRRNGQPFYSVWDGSGAGYWQPGHGRYSTTWNLNVIVESGADRGERVNLEGLAEGPDAFILGIHGNRDFDVEYFPAPKALSVNEEPSVRSLYDWQLSQRRE